MAVFGAPIALEDHALRACLTALDIQKAMHGLAAEVQARDGIHVQLRVGLNSGEVIAGDIGSRSWSYTAIGHQVGMAQRMEAAAPPGGVTLSESTARLVTEAAILGERQTLLFPDGAMLREAAETLRDAGERGDEFALSSATLLHGLLLSEHEGP
jgi:adenylate cyclase